jgi:hypothetical protein
MRGRLAASLLTLPRLVGKHRLVRTTTPITPLRHRRCAASASRRIWALRPACPQPAGIGPIIEPARGRVTASGIASCRPLWAKATVPEPGDEGCSPGRTSLVVKTRRSARRSRDGRPGHRSLGAVRCAHDEPPGAAGPLADGLAKPFGSRHRARCRASVHVLNTGGGGVLAGRADEARDDELAVRGLRGRCYRASSQLIIHGVPKRSTSMPKRRARKVFWIGISAVPFSARA